MWDEQLASLDEDVSASKRWRSGYWMNWYRELVLDVGEAELPGDSEDYAGRDEQTLPSICETLWSNAGSPPRADGDRRETPAAHHEHQQGGLSKWKPLVTGVRPSAVGDIGNDISSSGSCKSLPEV